MNCKYRVTLDGIKGFFRVYSVNRKNSLYTFHKQLRSDLEFPVDQPIMFKAFDDAGNITARYALVDLGFGTVDDITVDDTVRSGITKFVYFYDLSARKSVTITLEGECDDCSALPSVIETKGPLPIDFENGYVAFEDLVEEQKRNRRCDCGKDECDCSDNEDFDDNDGFDDDEEEDKEEEELIYDTDE